MSSDGEESFVMKESTGKERGKSNLNVVRMERMEVKEMMENE